MGEENDREKREGEEVEGRGGKEVRERKPKKKK